MTGPGSCVALPPSPFSPTSCPRERTDADGRNLLLEQKGGDDLDTFYSTIEGMDGSGSMMWSIFGHGASLPRTSFSLLVFVLTKILFLQTTAAATGSTT